LSEHHFQCERILKLLESYAPNFVPLPEILDLRIASHTRRIHELRKAGHVIEMREHREGMERHTEYRLVV
jgi:hypothetical protein